MYISIYAHLHTYNILDKKKEVIAVPNMNACFWKAQHMVYMEENYASDL